MSPNNTDKRKATRVTFDTKVTIKTDNPEQVSLAESRNVSVSGLFVTTDEDFPIGTHCDIHIQLGGDADGPSIKVKGKVVRKDRNGVGISFESVDVDSFIHLKNVVRYNAENPDAVEKERVI